MKLRTHYIIQVYDPAPLGTAWLSATREDIETYNAARSLCALWRRDSRIHNWKIKYRIVKVTTAQQILKT